MSSMVELYVRPSTLLLKEPPVSMPAFGAGTDEWSPWPMKRPRILARTNKLNVARARLGVIIRDMLELQQKHGTTALKTQYLSGASAIYARFQDWMHSLEHKLQSCELATQQLILLQ